MSVVASSAAGVSASLLSSSPSSSSRPLPHQNRAYRSLTSPAASRGGSRRRRRLQVHAARTESTGVSVGFRAPQFELPEPLTGRVWTLDDFEVYPALLKGLASVAISSNSIVTHPQDGPDFMAEEAKLFKYSFPYLYDESQEVAKAFQAVCTPEFYLFKKDGRRPFELFYHGQFDDSRPSSNAPVTGRDLSRAIDCALSRQELPFVPKPSVGCSIKWHP
ncbi:uncharacterized protein LOC100836277 isoform X2 [Brachypodium distachyon]|uniref:Alkyl hydroperoxide reductase subunit C/ Thiol specific antioxidant domain-containing protein n=1 Tax=Brachypodium distachyon TaxID=15368 RepID=I1H2C2_BRADI|nr:uncharacterized protein LOC100836277 isoform X2 [Brachypodium distachyon]PNT76766.1 hypothetical protein BRADI_1g53100v3 [Brachypodium distachyon]|eukprot:XP_014752767.1 uncharacterized protein LOC100836277 isoform X2 [Brachypodium distachyon]